MFLTEIILLNNFLFQERISRLPSKEKSEEGEMQLSLQQSQSQKFFSEVWFPLNPDFAAKSGEL